MRKKETLARIPESLADLERLALNLMWSWDGETRDLFSEVDEELWKEVRQNPVALLSRVDPKRLEALSSVPGFLERTQKRSAALKEYMERKNRPEVAYLSMEYGLHESLPIYSGGLGVLSGDHLKASSDLGLPLVAVGLLYRKGYFSQRVDGKGRQYERLPHVDPESIPAQLVCDERGEPVVVDVEVGSRTVGCGVWLLQVGKVELYLLDTDLEKNAEDDRRISWQLYIGERRKRLEQEIVLGVGAVRLLEDTLGIVPRTYHLNEGHSALSLIERLRREATKEGGYDLALEKVRSKTVFTTHTPVAAGNEEFSSKLVGEHFSGACKEMGIDVSTLLGLGSTDGESTEAFSLTVLALKLSRYANAVSRLHGEVCREMWRDLWPDREVEKVPISHITNGVHGPTWLGGSMARVPASNSPSRDNTDEELWKAHCDQKARLIEFARRRMVDEGLRRGETESALRALSEGLSTERLTIGFARRFATYKRGALLLAEPGRLDSLLNHKTRPMQLIFAGKAHPADPAGKKIIQSVFEASRNERFAGRIVFLEDYDMELGRLLTGGVDLWLNNPVRPMEACGTSGMKAAMNGVLNCSIRDGWWDEVEEEGYGFSIAPEPGIEPEGPKRNAADREALLKLLGEVVSPMYYDRGEEGIPRRWVETMRRGILDLSHRFSARRMVDDYRRLAYEL